MAKVQETINLTERFSNLTTKTNVKTYLSKLQSELSDFGDKIETLKTLTADVDKEIADYKNTMDVDDEPAADGDSNAYYDNEDYQNWLDDTCPHKYSDVCGCGL